MQARGIWSAGQGDDKERFLADLRTLRDKAALGYDELAARTHYPSDVLKEADNGPSLPGLPILAAYVRACGADVPDWEERWRSLGFEARVDPGLPVRPAGASPAAVAGARAGITVAPPDAYDPERIRAALRGRHGHEEQAARRTDHQETAAAGLGLPSPKAEAAGPQIPGIPQSLTGWNVDGWGDTAQRDSRRGSGGGAQPEVGGSWDPSAGHGVPSADANGHHHAGPRSTGPFDGAVAPAPDHAGNPQDIRHDPFSAAWLQDSELTSPPPAPRNTWFAPQEDADREQTWRRAEGGVTRPPADGGPAPRQEEGGPASPAPTDFWTSSAAATTPADVQRPTPAPPTAEQQPVPPSSWPPPPEVSSTPVPSVPHRAAPEPTRRAAPDLRQGAASPVPAQSQTPTGSAVPRPAPAPPSESRRDRLFPLRLLVVIVAAALIGSILVMVLK